MSDKLFDGVELPDEALEGVAGGLWDIFKNPEPITITTADMVASAKSRGLTKEAAVAEFVQSFQELAKYGFDFPPERIEELRVEFEQLW